MSQRPADLFGYLPMIVEVSPQPCDGDCPPWWSMLMVPVKAGECTPMPIYMRWAWHRLHAGDFEAERVTTDGLLH